ncbi:MAG TPA: 3-hydroxyacyl-ACP dehydratase FabZ family protein [Candidatus Saccharimonadales bacterium]|nr:3-hydroxyacyl-ACP dehydratase FabZ family protein [Candidatus Saccharimonadales bacterium]
MAHVHNPELLPVADVLPHRPPRLWLDGVEELSPGVFVRGFWTPAEEQFDGHFPGEPVLQGVQQIEAIAQLGGYAAMYEQPGELGVLFGSTDTEFKSPVFPGDTLELYVGFAEQRRKSLFEGVGQAMVNGVVVCESKISGRIMPKSTLNRILQAARDQRTA